MKCQDNIHQDTWRRTNCSYLSLTKLSFYSLAHYLLMKLNTQDIVSINPNEHERVLIIKPNAHVQANGHDIYINGSKQDQMNRSKLTSRVAPPP